MSCSIGDREAYLSAAYKDNSKDTGLFVKLVEEIGELAELPDRRDGRKADDEGGTQTQLAYELADVIQ